MNQKHQFNNDTHRCIRCGLSRADILSSRLTNNSCKAADNIRSFSAASVKRQIRDLVKAVTDIGKDLA